ncbi:hypothetical protein CA13_40870 [Planctomycetes bacterium CA13]|uniref:Flagellar protein FlgJ N-terminal domain-containing protein n=1 Tax=Novipirellula herctigrandis TaxID=2527986 RepID=A0A5C5Z5U9_9BACT|nr:hypothetical protein CA13_40870 [Planctomycetes bacterium CA13]
MNIQPSASFDAIESQLDRTKTPKLPGGETENETKEAFTKFVGETMFGSMLSSMRKTVGKPAYFHGGRTEEVFQKQLDQLIVEDLTESSASTIADPMFDLFQMNRRP